MYFIINLLLVSTLVYSVQPAKILGVSNLVSVTHFNLMNTLMKELVKKGHQVTLISAFGIPSPIENYRSVLLEGFIEIVEEHREKLLKTGVTLIDLHLFGLKFSEATLNHPNVQKLLQNSSEEFDLIIIDYFNNEPLRALSYRFSAPYIIFNALAASSWVNFQSGNPSLPSYVPDYHQEYTSSMTFFERFINTLVYYGNEAFRHFVMFPQHDMVIQHVFPGAPSVKDLYYNASLILINSHFSYYQTEPTAPSLINIGGFHLQPPQSLPQDLQKFLDDSKEGVIYFSLGSFIRSSDMNKAMSNAVLKSFSSLRQKVLMKWEKGDIPERPHNVKIVQWLPQTDVLAHPNIKLFVSHGGLMSNAEAVYHGVPILGIPVSGDGLAVTKNAVRWGYGLRIPYAELTENKLTWALNEMLNNTKYRKNAQKRSKLLRDQPLNPLETSMYWIEYVLRHKGAPHLRSAGLDLAWYQHFMIDIALFLSLLILIWCVISYYIFKRIWIISKSYFNCTKYSKIKTQ